LGYLAAERLTTSCDSRRPITYFGGPTVGQCGSGWVSGGVSWLASR